MRTDPRDRLIVALDVADLARAEQLMDRLQGLVTTYKVGSQLFTAAGPAAVESVRKRGGRVFLDLKFHDIPTTVAGAVREAVGLGCFMVNVHAAGGSAMLRAAAEAAAEAARALSVARPLLLAVTVLTSLDRAALQRELNVPLAVEGQVLHLAGLAKAAGLDGCVASAQEARLLRGALGREWVIVTPGIRPSRAPTEGGSATDDQARSLTPAEAIRAGADYLVVGRPITQAEDPASAAQAIIQELAGG